MAKARQVPGLDGDDPFRVAAAKVVSVRGDELFEQSVNVLDISDIERVHDMRVATRRLRAVLEIFAPCFERTLHRGVLGDVKSLADALGERRDPDVHIDVLQHFASAVAEADRPGVESLVARLRDDQAAGNATLSRALEEIDRSDLRGRLRALCEAAGTAG
jgi:CHAD domain-containing protein